MQTRRSNRPGIQEELPFRHLSSKGNRQTCQVGKESDNLTGKGTREASLSLQRVVKKCLIIPDQVVSSLASDVQRQSRFVLSPAKVQSSCQPSHANIWSCCR